MKKYKSTISNVGLCWKKSNFLKAKLINSKDAAEYARQFFSDDINIYESFFLILLNQANNTIAWVKISQGGISSSVVDIRIIAKYCIETFAAAVILCHNHPTGTLQASNQDINITKKIKETLALFDSKVLDHIILTEESHYSFADEGIL